MIKKSLISLAAALSLLPLGALALPIVYTYSGVGSGMVGGTTFGDASFTITANADTDNIQPWMNAFGGPQNTHLSTSIQIAGVGIFTIITPSHTWLSQTNSGGLGANLGTNWITLDAPEFVSVGYGLATNFGPVVDSTPSDFSQFYGVQTSGGSLSIEPIQTVTFQAALVPEPATYALMLVGVAALGLLVRHRSGATA